MMAKFCEPQVCTKQFSAFKCALKASMPYPNEFEMTVFFAAHLMVITFYMRSKLWPFKQAENPDVRTTDDHFLMEVAVNNNEEELTSFFKNTGAVEVKVIDKE